MFHAFSGFGRSLVSGLSIAAIAAAANPAGATPVPPMHSVCSAPWTPPSLRDVIYADRNPIAEAQQLVGSTVVRLELEPSGRVHEATVLESSGFPGLDSSALDTLRVARYTPETVNCKAVGGSYSAVVQFK